MKNEKKKKEVPNLYQKKFTTSNLCNCKTKITTKNFIKRNLQFKSFIKQNLPLKTFIKRIKSKKEKEKRIHTSLPTYPSFFFMLRQSNYFFRPYVGHTY